MVDFMSAANLYSKARILIVSHGGNEALEALVDRFKQEGCEVEIAQWRDFEDLEEINTLLFTMDLLLIELATIDTVLLRSLCNVVGKPTLVLSDDASVESKIACFKAGVDDYVVNPFSLDELYLRIAATLKRFLGYSFYFEDTEEVAVENICLNSAKQEVKVDEWVVPVTPLEFKLLWLLVSSRGRVLSKSHTYLTVLGREYGAFDRTIDMHLSRIRKKLNGVGIPGQRIRTVRGQGYCFT